MASSEVLLFYGVQSLTVQWRCKSVCFWLSFLSIIFSLRMKVIYQTGCSRVVFHQLNVAISLINSCYYFISSRNKSYISSHYCHYNCNIHSVLTVSLFLWILCCSQTCSFTPAAARLQPVGGGPERGMCCLRAAFSSIEGCTRFTDNM